MLLNEKVGELTYDGLFVNHVPEADVFSVTVSAGEGILKRGTVLALGEDGKMSVLDVNDTTLKANCILAEDIDATEEAIALAYRTGHFNEQALLTKDDAEMNAANKEALRDVGILVSDTIAY